MRNVVPWPGAESTSIWPWFCWTALYTSARPSPVPEPAGFVVKKGSNTRARTSSVMPWPESETESTT